MYTQERSRTALGKMTLGKPQHDDDLENPWINDLTPEQDKVLDDWIKLFKRKYPVVGSIKRVEEKDKWNELNMVLIENNI